MGELGKALPYSLPASPLPFSTEALFGQPPFASRSFSELEEKIRSKRVIEVRLAGSWHPLGIEGPKIPEVCSALPQTSERL